MSQRLHLEYDREQRYGSEVKNRDKGSKMSEIEIYVSILIENNKVYADELNILRKQNTDQRGEIQIIMRDKFKQKQKYQGDIANIKSGYTQQVNKMIDELRDILSQNEQMQASYKTLIEYISYQYEFQKKTRFLQVEELERNYQNKIKNLADKLNEESKQSEKNYYINSQNKVRFVQQIDNLNFQVNEYKKQINDFIQEIRQNNSQIIKLSGAIKLIAKQKQQMGVDVLKMEQDKNQSLIQLKKINNSLREQLDKSIENIKRLELSLINKDKQNHSLSDKNDLNKRQRLSIQDLYKNLNNKLNEKEAQLSSLKHQYSYLSDYSSKQMKRMSELIKLLESDNRKLLVQRQQLEHYNQIKQQQIYTLLDRVQCLDQQYQMAQMSSSSLQQEAITLRKQNSQLTQEVQSLLLQNTNEKQKGSLQLNHINTLEQIIQKEKRRHISLQSNHNEKNANIRHLPKDTSKRYQNQIEDILRRTANQKAILRDRFELEKQRLIITYQKALREKETIFKQKIKVLQNQVLEMSRN